MVSKKVSISIERKNWAGKPLSYLREINKTTSSWLQKRNELLKLFWKKQEKEKLKITALARDIDR